jgi:hypothetical protein
MGVDVFIPARVAVLAAMKAVEPGRPIARVEVLPNDKFTMDVFALGYLSKNDSVRRPTPLDQMPEWVMQTISMLRIAEKDVVIPELGYKVSDTLYYVFFKEDADA